MQSCDAAPAAPDPDALGQLKSLVLARKDLQARLVEFEEDGAFSAAAAEIAGAHGLQIDPDAVRGAIRPDPLGLSRWSGHGGEGAIGGWPGPEWLPMHLDVHTPDPTVEWVHFAGRRLTDPFFEESVRNVAARPFNRLLRLRMPLRDFLAGAEAQESPAPCGLVFHMSRCGSTLLAQMLAAAPANVVVSEAPPIDAMVQLSGTGDAAARGLKAMAAALGRQPAGEAGRTFLKLDSWHALALPLFRRAFPDTPWVFLYRDPLEVMVSQMAQRGLQTVHGALDPRIFGIDGGEAMPGEAYCAAVLEKTCRAALEHLSLGDGMLVDYRELPDALWTRILPHFGAQPTAEELRLMQTAAGLNAKAPYEAFAPDGASKRARASETVREVTARRLAPVYAELEAVRLAGSQPGLLG